MNSTTIKYITYDGTEFANMQECRDYEHLFAEMCREKFELLNSTECDGSSFLESAEVSFCSDDKIKVINILNNDTLKVINDYLMSRNCGREKRFGEDLIGETLAFWCWDDEEDSVCLGTREDMLARFDRALDNLFGKEIKKEDKR